jgi:glycosyltransferase involved in cell wall biosynthesis
VIAEELPLISVVVPVYNVEAYVRECVESLVAQTYPNLEIMLVDDGATDSSGAICDELAAVHDNVTCLHKENGGPSSARNYGVLQVHGEWVSFIDADDYVSPFYLEALYNAVANLRCPIACVSGGTNFFDGEECSLIDADDAIPQPAEYSSADFERKILYQQVTSGSQWRLYRCDLVRSIPFPEDIVIGEDLACMYKLVHRAEHIALVDCHELYAYRMRPTSLIRQSYRHAKGYSAVTVADQLYRDISVWYPDLTKAASSRCFSVCRMVFGQVPNGSGASDEDAQDRKALWEALCRHRGVVAHDLEARPRERLAARIACMGEGPFTVFCHMARRMGKMQ